MKKLIPFFFLPLLLACANIKTPTGGPKDEKAPLLIKTIPEHNSTNFSGDRITLIFDEQIEPKGLSQELIITPDDNLDFRQIPKKKSITLKLKDTLRTNTTYNFNFGNAIVDITEKNICQGAKLAFSTGKDIDTAFIKGQVIDIFSQEPVKNGIVILQNNVDSLNAEDDKPNFLSRIDEEGFFILENLPLDSFHLYAIIDLNNNLLFNSGKEKIARYPQKIIPSYEDTLIQLYVAQQNTKEFKLYGIEHNYNYTTIRLNKGSYTFTAQPDTFYTFSTDKNRKTNFFHPFLKEDSLKIDISFIDSSNFVLDTFFYVKSNPEGDTLIVNSEITTFPPTGEIREIPDSIIFKSNFDFKSVDIDTTIIILNNKDTIISREIDYKLLNNKELIIKYVNKAQSLSIKSINCKIITILDDTMTNLSAKYILVDETKYGQIEGSIKTSHSNVILELIDSGGKIQGRQKTKDDFLFHTLKPGTYKLRAIVDENQNNKWDPGNHLEQKQPEPVFIYEEEMLLKANWILQDKVFIFN